MSSRIYMEMTTGLGLSHLDSEHRLHPVLASALKKAVTVVDVRRGPYWSPEYFGLSSCEVFVRSSDAQRAQILKLCSDELLYEVYYIEKAGMAYAAKMSVLSQTVEERMLYSMFASEEAAHFELISAFVARPPEGEPNKPFLSLMSNAIENGDRDGLIFVIQVVLEGWGITHYRRIAEGCEDRELKSVFDFILKDEARHHGSGLVLFDGQKISISTREWIVDVMTHFLSLVRQGPQSVVSAVESVLGPQSKLQKIKLFESLNAFEHSTHRLGELRQLMLKAKANQIVEALDEKGFFRAYSAQECAA